jgi:transposase
LVDPALLKPGCINDKNLLVRLFSAGFTHEEIAQIFGVSRPNVTKMIARMDLVRETADPVLFQERMHEEILVRMEALLKYITPEKMNKASLSQLIMAFGTLYDKMRLHRGESTANVASLNVHKIDVKDLDKIRDIIKKHTDTKLKEARKGYEDDALLLEEANVKEL